MYIKLKMIWMGVFDMNDYYIYLTTNLINGKKYIGQHKGLPDDDYLGSGSTFLKALKKYGKENFSKEILCFCQTREEADKKEREIIQFYNAVEDKTFYNNSEGGTGGDGWRSYQRWCNQHPEEALKQWRKNAQRLQEWRKNNPIEYHEKCVIPMHKGLQEWRKNNPDKVWEHTKRLNQGKEEWQKSHPEEHQKQVDEWRKMGSIANSQQILCITTGKIFPSLSEAARYYNISQPNISKCLKGERKSAGKDPETGEKLFWKRVDKKD